jgi:hypothetical protein
VGILDGVRDVPNQEKKVLEASGPDVVLLYMGDLPNLLIDLGF